MMRTQLKDLSSKWIDTTNKEGMYFGEMSFTHISKDKIIIDITLANENNQAQIWLCINNIYYQQFSNFIIDNGYPKPDNFEKDFYKYRIHIPNTNFLIDFLETLKKINPDIELIRDPIAYAHFIRFPGEPTIPRWIREYDLAVNSQEDFRSCNKTSKIKKLSLGRDRSAEVSLYVYPTKAGRDDIYHILQKHGRIKTGSSKTMLSLTRLKIRSTEDLRMILDNLSEAEPDVTFATNAIIERYSRYVHPLDESYAKTSSLGFYGISKTTDNQLPQFNIDGDRIDTPKLK